MLSALVAGFLLTTMVPAQAEGIRMAANTDACRSPYPVPRPGQNPRPVR